MQVTMSVNGAEVSREIEARLLLVHWPGCPSSSLSRRVRCFIEPTLASMAPLYDGVWGGEKS